jgi:hypothetical protein
MNVTPADRDLDPIAEATRAVLALMAPAGTRFSVSEPRRRDSGPRYEDVYGLIVRAAAAGTANCTQAAPPSTLKLRGTSSGLRYECSHAPKHCYDYRNGANTKC